MNEILQYLTVFVLSVVVGFEVISKVPSILHTPLMSGSNAIHGVILVGAMIVLGSATTTPEIVLGTLAVLLATLNVVGGFVVTDRMLEMFKGKPDDTTVRRQGRLVSRGTFLDLCYLVAAITFIVALKGLSSPRHARRGNLVAVARHDARGRRHLRPTGPAPPRVDDRGDGARHRDRRADVAVREDDRDPPAGRHLQRRRRRGGRARLDHRVHLSDLVADVLPAVRLLRRLRDGRRGEDRRHLQDPRGHPGRRDRHRVVLGLGDRLREAPGAHDRSARDLPRPAAAERRCSASPSSPSPSCSLVTGSLVWLWILLGLVDPPRRRLRAAHRRCRRAGADLAAQLVHRASRSPPRASRSARTCSSSRARWSGRRASCSRG